MEEGHEGGEEDLRKSFTKFGYLMGGISFTIPYGAVLLILSSSGLKKKKGGPFPALFILFCAMVLVMNMFSVSMLLVIFNRHPPTATAPIGRKTVTLLKCLRIATLLLIFPVVLVGFILLILM